MSCELYQAFKQLNDDDQLRVGIVTAQVNKKRIFSGGWDLKAFAQWEGVDGDITLDPGGIGGLPDFWGLYKPVIAAVNGITAGGSFEMVLGADLIVATDDSPCWSCCSGCAGGSIQRKDIGCFLEAGFWKLDFRKWVQLCICNVHSRVDCPLYKFDNKRMLLSHT